MFIYFERERERDRQTPSGFRAVSTEPVGGLEPTSPEIMTRAEIKGWMLNPLSHPAAPV